MQLVGERIVSDGRRGAMAINAFAAGDGEQPCGKAAARIELIHFLESLHKAVLRQLAGVGRVAAKLRHKGVDTTFVAIHQLLKSIKGAGLRLAGQILVGNKWKFLSQWNELLDYVGMALLFRGLRCLGGGFPRGIGLDDFDRIAGRQNERAKNLGAILLEADGVGKPDGFRLVGLQFHQ